MKNYQEGDKKGYKVMVLLSEDFKPGKVKEHILINTNNPKKPVVKIPVSGRILGDIMFTPSSLSFVSSNVGISNVRRVILINNGDIPLKIENVKVDHQNLTHEIKTMNEGKKIEIVLTFSPTKDTPKSSHTRMYITTNIPDQKIVEIPIYTSVRQYKPRPKHP